MGDININVFTENLSKHCIKPYFSVMSIAEAWGQSGIFIATNLSTASKLIRYPRATKKIFYIWDLEFIRGNPRPYELFARIYLNPELELACRSKEHADLVENCYNRQVSYISPNFDLRPFLQ